jgi:hypothetical protein
MKLNYLKTTCPQLQCTKDLQKMVVNPDESFATKATACMAQCKK